MTLKRPLGFFGQETNYHWLTHGVGKHRLAVQAGIFEITAADAALCLEERNTDNFRAITRGELETLNRAVTADEWIFNGNPLIFDDNGVLRDGQKRLTACKESGKAIVCLVLAGVSYEADPTFDINETRTFRQQLSKRGEQGVTQLAALVRNIMRMRDGKEKDPRKYSMLAMLRFYEENQEALRAAIVTNHIIRGVSDSTGSTLLFEAAPHGYRPEAELFLHKIRTGTGLNPGDPILLLRKRMLGEKGTMQKGSVGLRLDSTVRQALFILTWNAWVKGLKTSVLRWVAYGPLAQEFPKFEFPARLAACAGF